MFSTLDLRSGYWQLPVHKEDQVKTAFCSGPGLGLFQFCRMPFGLSGAPGSFQRLMDKICRELPFVTTYLDDVLIHSRTMEEHKEHLQMLFGCLSTSGLTLRSSKCHVGLSQVKYLGHMFSAKGMESDPQKKAAVHEWAVPRDVKDLRTFLGFKSYYRRYICEFADIASPLHQLTSNDVPFVWSTVCQSAFEQLKGMFTRAPVLKYPNFCLAAGQFQLQTDASARGIGAVLEQDGHDVAYCSRALSKSEQNYSTIQRECLAIVVALKQFLLIYLVASLHCVLTMHHCNCYLRREWKGQMGPCHSRVRFYYRIS